MPNNKNEYLKGEDDSPSAADCSASSSYAEMLVEATREAAGRCDFGNPYWDETGEEEGCYCVKCAELLFPDSVDGGWIGEEDSPPVCGKCGIPLDFTFTDYGVEETLKHIEETGIHSDYDAFCVHAMMGANGCPLLTEGNYKPEWKDRIKVIYEAL